MKYELELTREQFEQLCAQKGWRLFPDQAAAYVDDVNSIDYSGSAGPTTDCNFGAMVQTATTAARNLDVDYASLRTIQLGNRFT